MSISFQEAMDYIAEAEFMLGVGPEWIHLKQNGRWSNSIAGEIAADFMFWPTRKHRFGWYVDSSWAPNAPSHP
jgi:hypothetical protein